MNNKIKLGIITVLLILVITLKVVKAIDSNSLTDKELTSPSAVKMECERLYNNYRLATDNYWYCLNFMGPPASGSMCIDLDGLYEKHVQSWREYEERCNPILIA